MVPIPTPAAAAMSRTGASTPDVTNTAAAAESNACSLRCASARIFRGGCPAPSSLVVIASFLTQQLDKRNMVPYNSIGAVLHFLSILWRNTIMQYRTLGRTGITASQLCLGALMFGPFGNPDHDESI